MTSRSVPHCSHLEIAPGWKVEPDAWLASQMGRRVVVLHRAPETTRQSPVRVEAPAFVYAKVPTDQPGDVLALTSMGLSVVDTTLQFACASGAVMALATEQSAHAGRADVADISWAGEGDVAAVADIAASSFQWSRFHLDAHLDLGLADHLKAEWARNLAAGRRGVGCLVAKRWHEPVGFLGVLAIEDSTPSQAVIDLIAVAPQHRGSRVGRRLVAELAAWSLTNGLAEIRVGTQATNIGSVRFYESLGFRLVASHYVMHGHATS